MKNIPDKTIEYTKSKLKTHTNTRTHTHTHTTAGEKSSLSAVFIKEPHCGECDILCHVSNGHFGRLQSLSFVGFLVGGWTPQGGHDIVCHSCLGILKASLVLLTEVKFA